MPPDRTFLGFRASFLWGVLAGLLLAFAATAWYNVL